MRTCRVVWIYHRFGGVYYLHVQDIQIFPKVISPLIFAWTCIIDINNVDSQLDETITVLLIIPISSTCFGQFFAHPQELKSVCYSLWHNAPTLLSAGSLERGGSASAFQDTNRQQLGCIIPQAVKQSLALLRMGKKLPETCWADWNINKVLLLHLVGHLRYLYVGTFSDHKILKG